MRSLIIRSLTSKIYRFILAIADESIRFVYIGAACDVLNEISG